MGLVSSEFLFLCFFFLKQKRAYEIKECDWSPDVCSSDLAARWTGAGARCAPRTPSGRSSTCGTRCSCLRKWRWSASCRRDRAKTWGPPSSASTARWRCWSDTPVAKRSLFLLEQREVLAVAFGGQAIHRDEPQRRGIDAVAQPRRLGTVVEEMAQV